jgi:hypothetical protein
MRPISTERGDDGGCGVAGSRAPGAVERRRMTDLNYFRILNLVL